MLNHYNSLNASQHRSFFKKIFGRNKVQQEENIQPAKKYPQFEE
jgi:hypothetical protein